MKRALGLLLAGHRPVRMRRQVHRAGRRAALCEPLARRRLGRAVRVRLEGAHPRRLGDHAAVPGVPKTTAPHEPTDDFTVLTATGQVPVNGTCVELVTDKIVWVLIGPAAVGLRAGQRVKVTGLPDPAFSSRSAPVAR